MNHPEINPTSQRTERSKKKKFKRIVSRLWINDKRKERQGEMLTSEGKEEFGSEWKRVGSAFIGGRGRRDGVSREERGGGVVGPRWTRGGERGKPLSCNPQHRLLLFFFNLLFVCSCIFDLRLSPDTQKPKRKTKYSVPFLCPVWAGPDCVWSLRSAQNVLGWWVFEFEA